MRRERGYRFHLIYLWLPDPLQSVRRVEGRVKLGGHSVPPDVVRRRYDRGLKNFLALYSPIADSWVLYDNSNIARLIARRELGGSPEIIDAENWAMIERVREAKEREVRYELATKKEGFAGFPIDKITESLQAAGRAAWRRHKALGHPIVIWRDGKVVEVPPEEIEV